MDKRFENIVSDPKFKLWKKPNKKDEPDERFQTIPELKYHYDKRGWKICEDDEDREDEDEEDEESLSSSSDESETDVSDLEESISSDHEVEEAESITSRLAIQNFDWENLNAKDIFVLVNSIRLPKSVKIYISEFGKERLAVEEKEGPKELADMAYDEDEEEEKELIKLEKRVKSLEDREKISKFKINEYEDADEMVDPKNEELRERIRRYQLSKMKYYYAIIEFESPEVADIVYKELDGMEYEGSSLELDLRFVPDDMEFSEEDVKSECCTPPDSTTYKAPQFINTALQQTTVKLTWDETDPKRQHQLRRAQTKEELEKDDLEAYLASDSDEEEEEPEKYKSLLKDLEEDEANKNKTDVDVVWGDYEGDEEALTAKVMPEKGNKNKGDLKKNRKKRPEKDGEELDLLMLDCAKEPEGFEFDPEDERFNAVYESGLYNIDPSHPSFKRTQAFNQMAEKKRQRRT